MRSRVTILFVGNFLSLSTGTQGISEKLVAKLESNFLLSTASSIQNKVLRILHMCFYASVLRYHTLHIDVFSGSAFTFVRVCSFIGQLRKKKIILTLRGGNLSAFVQQHESLVKRVFDRATVIQTPSLMLKSKMASQLGIEVSYLPNFIDLTRFAYKREEVKPFTILWVRAFGKIYNPEMAIQVLAEVRKTYPTATLTMVGPDKGLLTLCKILIEKLGLSNAVTITGPLKNEELFTYYQRHQVYVNTPRFESFGVAVLEAASCGIPVVSFSVGEIPYLWQDGETMMLVEHGDIQGMAKAVTTIMKSPELERKLSLNARKKSEQFSWETVQYKWKELLETV